MRDKGAGSRREFITIGIGVGMSAVLSGCITKRFAPPKDEEAQSAAGPLERELRVFNWSDYIPPGTISRFEKEFGVKIWYDTYESNEEMVAKLVAGGGGYDIVGPSGYLIPVLAEGGLLQPLDHSVLTNWPNLLPIFADGEADPGGRYGMPYQWGTTGIAYRRDLLPNPPSSWGVFADPALRARMTMLDDGREVLGAMLKWRGHSFNSTTKAELDSARGDALAVKPNLRAYVSGPVKGQLVSGDIALAQIWSGDARLAQIEEPRIEFVLPSEGSALFTDYIAICRNAPSRRAAHAFFNFVLRPEEAAEIANLSGGGPTVASAIPLMKRPVPPPDAVAMSRLEFQRDLGAATDLWDRLWTEVKAG